jgi:hypothetical protein
MPIITKPSTVTKNEAAQFTLNKTELSNHASVVGNTYFHDTSNWKEVIIKFVSTTGSQIEILVFDATKTTPTASFLVSDKARDVFEGDHITILDHDGGSLKIQKSDLSSEFVINMSVIAPLGISIDWDITNSNYQEELNGGLTSTNTDTSTSGIVYGYTPIDTTQDFELVYNFNSTEFNATYFTTFFIRSSFIGFSDSAKSSFSGLYSDNTIANDSKILMSNQPISGYLRPVVLNGPNILKFKKVSSVFTVTLNNVIAFQDNGTSLPVLILPAVRCLGGIVITEVSLYA